MTGASYLDVSNKIFQDQMKTASHNQKNNY